MRQYDDYKPFDEDKANYLIGWSSPPKNSSNFQFPSGSLSRSFQYVSAKDFDSLPYLGIYSNYMGGGYVYNMSHNYDNALADLENLQSSEWLSKETRALFVEFSIFNPNINLFAYCMVLFEFLPTGNIIKSARFDPINLYALKDGTNSLSVLLDIIYLAIIFLLMVKEMRDILKKGNEYFSDIEKFFDWSLFVFSWVTLAMYIYKIKESIKILATIKNSSVQSPINLQNIDYWDGLITIFFAICSFIGILKLIKFLAKSRTILILVQAFKTVILKLNSLMFILFICVLSYSQLFYLVLYENDYKFSTFIKSLETTFQITLGKFGTNFNSIPFIGYAMFISYNVIVVLALINLFFAIIGDSLIIIRNKNLNQKDLGIYKYLNIKINTFKERLNKKMKKSEENATEENQKEPSVEVKIESINIKISNLLENFNE